MYTYYGLVYLLIATVTCLACICFPDLMSTMYVLWYNICLVGSNVAMKRAPYPILIAKCNSCGIVWSLWCLNRFAYDVSFTAILSTTKWYITWNWEYCQPLKSILHLLELFLQRQPKSCLAVYSKTGINPRHHQREEWSTYSYVDLWWPLWTHSVSIWGNEWEAAKTT